MNKLIIFTHFVALCLLSARALDGSQVYGTQNEDCKPYITGRNNTLNQNSSESTSQIDSTDSMCPPWYYRDQEGIGACKPGNDFSYVLLCQINPSNLPTDTLLYDNLN